MSIRTDVDTRNEAWAKDKSSFGQRMLSKMGWEEGTGLGKNKQGTVNSLRAVRRSVNLGIGASTDLHGEEGFNATKNNFLGVLEKLKEEHGIKNEKKSKKSKKKKKNADGGITLAQNRVSAGHSRKMRDSKDLSKKSKEDMAAIFGMKVDAYTTSSVWGSLKHSSVSVSDSKDTKSKTQPQEIDNNVVSLDSSIVSSDNDIDSQQVEKLNNQTKKKKKKDKSSEKSGLKKDKKKKRKGDSTLNEGTKRSKKKSRK